MRYLRAVFARCRLACRGCCACVAARYERRHACDVAQWDARRDRSQHDRAVASTVLTYLVGSRDDPADFPGMAHANEHMMFRGTKDLSTAELGTIATALGGTFNAQTAETRTQYQFTVPAADLGYVLHIESDRMRGILALQSQWRNERGAIEQEVARDETAPGNDFFSGAAEIAFRGTPYEHPGVGTKAAFDRLTGPEIKAFHDRWYAPNNAVLVIAGDVDPAKTIADVRTRFDAIPARAIPPHAAAELQPLKRVALRRTTTLAYPLAAIGLRMPGIDSPGFSGVVRPAGHPRVAARRATRARRQWSSARRRLASAQLFSAGAVELCGCGARTGRRSRRDGAPARDDPHRLRATRGAR